MKWQLMVQDFEPKTVVEEIAGRFATPDSSRMEGINSSKYKYEKGIFTIDFV